MPSPRTGSLLALILLSAVACSPAPPGGAEGTGGPEVRTWIEGDPSGGVGTLVVQVEAPSGITINLPEPEVPDLTFTEADPPLQERIANRVLTTRRFRFTGPAGSYEIPALDVNPDDTDLSGVSAPLWVDLGNPKAGLELADIDSPAPVFVWWPIFAFLAVFFALLIAAVGLAVFLARTRWAGRVRSLPPEPPDVVALRRWDAIRSDPAVDDLARAVALANILRDYQEAALGFPATTWTTSEILRKLESMPLLPDGNVGRAKRILRATDYVKFADADARQAMFEELDDAFRTFVGTTRPRAWRGEP